jgi:ribulose-phosphate 3-epimerase
MVKLAPSILAADPLNLEKEIRRMEKDGCDWIHVDVMDGHFVPNLAYGPDVVRHLKRVTALPLDVHLMMEYPETMLDTFLDSGADILTIHAEAEGDIRKLLRRIRTRRAKAGLALKPETPLEKVTELIPETDLVLCMTVEPGFGGQELHPEVLKKIRKLRDIGYQGFIEADGGIREDNLKALVDSGLTVAVMGTALFHNTEGEAAVRRMHGIGA